MKIIRLLSTCLTTIGRFITHPPRVVRFVALAFIATVADSRAVVVQSLDDIQFWVGTGPNRAALVIDWNDGKNAPGETVGRAMAWGYRWTSGATDATGYDMLLAIDAADPRLTISFGEFAGYGAFVFGAGYDLDGDGGAFTFTLAPETGTASDPADDHLAYGSATNGFWSYLHGAINGNAVPANWLFAEDGASSHVLANGSWDAWSFSNYTTNPDGDLLPPALALAAMPEPSTSVLILSTLVVAGVRRRRQ